MRARSYPILILALGWLALFAACVPRPRAPATPLPTPTAIVYPPTWTPEIPTTTPFPPSPTPRPPTRTPSAEMRRIIAALKRTQALSRYRAQMDMSMLSPTRSFLGSQPGESVAVMSLEGRLNGKDSHWQIKGVLVSFLTGDPKRPLEIITVGNKMYIHGPVPFLGAMESRWYSAPRSRASDLSGATDPNGLLDFLGNANAELPPLTTTGKAQLGDTACEIYRGDERETGAFFVELGAQNRFPGGSENELKLNPQHGDLVLWICEDGYLRKIEIGIQAQAGRAAADTATLAISMTLSDPNVSVPIQAPPDAIPLPNPFLFPTPLPEPTGQTA